MPVTLGHSNIRNNHKLLIQGQMLDSDSKIMRQNGPRQPPPDHVSKEAYSYSPGKTFIQDVANSLTPSHACSNATKALGGSTLIENRRIQESSLAHLQSPEITPSKNTSHTHAVFIDPDSTPDWAAISLAKSRLEKSSLHRIQRERLPNSNRLCALPANISLRDQYNLPNQPKAACIQNSPVYNKSAKIHLSNDQPANKYPSPATSQNQTNWTPPGLTHNNNQPNNNRSNNILSETPTKQRTSLCDIQTSSSDSSMPQSNYPRPSGNSLQTLYCSRENVSGSERFAVLKINDIHWDTSIEDVRRLFNTTKVSNLLILRFNLDI